MQVDHWTGGTARGYHTGMYKPTLLIPLMFILVDGVRCKEDEPTGAQFGEACADEGQPCAEGLRCELGYCAQLCNDDSECETIEGFRHECVLDGVCYIFCDELTLACPQTLGTPMKCGINTCESAS